ncbi:MAG TPA: alpha/beta hydrolase-fold protein [Kofleriaceae bacterium]|nr:alpha/beta hydrolase-fold protein [Kofleriaceae bacterium]
MATWVCACGDGGGSAGDPDAGREEVADSAPDRAVDLFALHDQVRAGCDPERLADFTALVAGRRGELPAWDAGRALFVSDGAPVSPAGTWNDWTPGEATAPLCGGPLHTLEAAVPSGFHEYKVVDAGGAWRLDPENRAFAHDDFAGNPDGKNSVLATWDSGRGHLAAGDPICSDALGGCRAVTAYLPPGYAAPDRAGTRYPALFLHDGQNAFDDPTCCFGNGGWEINRTLDEEIAAGTVAPVVLVATDHGGSRRFAEYGGDAADEFMEFQVGAVQPAAAAWWRIDPARVYTAGSSLGGLIAFRLALAHPEVYAGAASLSGSFFVEDADGTSVADRVAELGRLDLALYLDHGGTAEDGSDNYASNRELLAALTAAGYARGDSPGCAPGPGRVCYFHADGATHDEAAWRARSWRFLRFLAPP